MSATRLTTVPVVLGAAIVAVLIAGVAAASVETVSSSHHESAQATAKLGAELCFGFGQASVVEYHETIRTLPDVVSEADVLQSSDDWRPVGDALRQLTTLGPTAHWTPTQRATGSLDLQALHAACVPHLK